MSRVGFEGQATQIDLPAFSRIIAGMLPALLLCLRLLPVDLLSLLHLGLIHSQSYLLHLLQCLEGLQRVVQRSQVQILPARLQRLVWSAGLHASHGRPRVKCIKF